MWKIPDVRLVLRTGQWLWWLPAIRTFSPAIQRAGTSQDRHLYVQPGILTVIRLADDVELLLCFHAVGLQVAVAWLAALGKSIPLIAAPHMPCVLPPGGWLRGLLEAGVRPHYCVQPWTPKDAVSPGASLPRTLGKESFPLGLQRCPVVHKFWYCLWTLVGE